MARWEEVVDAQVDLYKFWRSPVGEQYGHGFAESSANATYLSEEDKKAARLLQGEVAMRAAQFLYEAEPIWVDPDMMTLTERAAESFQPEPLHPNDILTDCGFLLLPRPVVVKDVWGKDMSYRAMSWKVVDFTYRITDTNDVVSEDKRGIFLYLYHQRGDPDGYDGVDTLIERKTGMSFPSLSLTHATPWVFGYNYFDGTDRDESRQLQSVFLGEEGKRVVLVDGALQEVPTEEALQGIKSIAQFVGAMFRLLTQTITVRTEMVPPREFRKRAKPWLPERKVVVVTLRKRREGAYPPDRDEGGVEWTHRWLVSGHWRNQWFPSLSVHRQIWISPFIKGPEELPLVIRAHRVFKLTR